MLSLSKHVGVALGHGVGTIIAILVTVLFIVGTIVATWRTLRNAARAGEAARVLRLTPMGRSDIVDGPFAPFIAAGDFKLASLKRFPMFINRELARYDSADLSLWIEADHGQYSILLSWLITFLHPDIELSAPVRTADFAALGAAAEKYLPELRQALNSPDWWRVYLNNWASNTPGFERFAGKIDDMRGGLIRLNAR
jgi:hypothetical protein